MTTERSDPQTLCPVCGEPVPIIYSRHEVVDGAFRGVCAGSDAPVQLPTSERIDPGAEQARRDDLARDVAQHTRRVRALQQRDATQDGVLHELERAADELDAALDRLADVYTPQDTPQETP